MDEEEDDGAAVVATEDSWVSLLLNRSTYRRCISFKSCIAFGVLSFPSLVFKSSPIVIIDIIFLYKSPLSFLRDDNHFGRFPWPSSMIAITFDTNDFVSGCMSTALERVGALTSLSSAYKQWVRVSIPWIKSDICKMSVKILTSKDWYNLFNHLVKKSSVVVIWPLYVVWALILICHCLFQSTDHLIVY